MPSSVRSDCIDFVSTYGPAVVALLEQELEPAVICGVLGLCPQRKGVPQLSKGDLVSVAVIVEMVPQMCELI